MACASSSRRSARSEASRAVEEASHRLLPALVDDGPLTIVDAGRATPVAASDGVLSIVGLAVVCVRQRRGSAVAVAADLERTAELCDVLAARAVPTMLAMVGTEPFGPAEIAAYVAGEGSVMPWCVLADDGWAAGVLAGRVGSPARLRRTPLLQSAARAIRRIDDELRRAAVAP